MFIPKLFLSTVFILLKSDFNEMAEVAFSYYHDNEDKTCSKRKNNILSCHQEKFSF